MKRALITGINGMDGSHLADFLLEKGAIDMIVDRRQMRDTISTLISNLMNH